MKKILLSLIALFSGVGAWAQVTDGTAQELTPGGYLIYYTEGATKHYLQTAGTSSIVTVTENPLPYSVKVGVTTGQYDKAYYLEMNGLRISNTNSNGNVIQTSTNSRTWESQVFLKKDGSEKYAIRLTNESGTSQWHQNYFIGKGDTEGTTKAYDPTTATDEDVYIWSVEEIASENVSYILTDMAGNTYTGTVAGYPGTMASIPGNGIFSFEDVTWSGNNVTADIVFPFPVSKAGGATNMTMIGSFNGAAFKWYADGTSVKVQKNVMPTPENVMNYLWAVYPSFSEGAFSFTMKNIATDKYICSTSAENNHNEGAVTLSETASALTLDGNQLKLSTGKYLSVNSTNTTDVQNLGTWGSHSGTHNAILAPTYNLEISEADAATLYTPFAVAIPENVTAKYIKAVDNATVTGGVLKYTTLEGAIPANTAVVAVGEAGTYTFTATTEEVAAVSDNVLFGFSTATEASATEHKGTGATGTVYALTTTGEPAVAAFGHFVGASYKAGKAYLDVKDLGTANAPFFYLFDNGGATGIDNLNVNAASKSNAVYDMSGRRVQRAQKGIYIINGKKVIK